MRYGIFSDVHSNLEALDAVLEAYKSESIDKYLCIGDIVGYAVNPAECFEKIKSRAAVTVAGNHDWAASGKLSIEYFNPYAAAAINWTVGILTAAQKEFLSSLELVFSCEHLTLVHGTLDNPAEFDYLFDITQARQDFLHLRTALMFVGHTHVPAAYVKEKDRVSEIPATKTVTVKPDNQYIINIGSVGQPRDNNPKASYSIYDTEKKEILIKRVDYDKEMTRRKIIDAGLPVFLGDRLLSGT
ncbi:MAG: metallophosphoesterase family protein [Candidatus Omnitrophota bacterium]